MSNLQVFANGSRFYVSFVYHGRTYKRPCDLAGYEYSFTFKGRLCRFF